MWSLDSADLVEETTLFQWAERQFPAKHRGAHSACHGTKEGTAIHLPPTYLQPSWLCPARWRSTMRRYLPPSSMPVIRTFYSRHAKQLNHFHLSCLLRPLHIRWQDKILDTKVLHLAGGSSVHTVLEQVQATWSGHVIRMPDSWLPKKLLYSWRTESGQVQSWVQKKHFKDCLKCPSKAWTSISTPWSCLPWIALPGLGDPQRVLLHWRKDAQQKLRESKLHAMDKQPSPPLQHPPTCVSEVGVPFWREQSHQSPLDIHSQIFHLTLKLRSSLTLTNKQHKSKWCINWPYFLS